MEHSMNGHQRRLERMANTHTHTEKCVQRRYKTVRNCCSPGGNSIRSASGIWDVLRRSLFSSSRT